MEPGDSQESIVIQANGALGNRRIHNGLVRRKRIVVGQIAQFRCRWNLGSNQDGFMRRLLQGKGGEVEVQNVEGDIRQNEKRDDDMDHRGWLMAYG